MSLTFVGLSSYTRFILLALSVIGRVSLKITAGLGTRYEVGIRKPVLVLYTEIVS